MYGAILGPPHSTTPAAVTTNKNTKVRSFKSSQNIQKKERGSDSTVWNNKFSSVTLNELAMKARDSSFNKAVNLKTDINFKWGPNSKNLFRIHGSKLIIFSDFSEYFR